ncbi:hypothetical protein ABZY14_22635 [Streptomyces sp. NPDC006617]|uniref:hypothetical protein n=1 Tax=Streptomyces sp. NPDC006617 TaxID=3155354 RepID=UPI0033BF12AF
MTHNTGAPATITPEMAAQIRRVALRRGLFWRAAARAASDLWGSPWGSNQLFGEDLCAAAAELLGENPCREPWN